MSGAKFQPIKVESSKLDLIPISEGQLIFTTDTKQIFLDASNNSRIKYTKENDGETSNSYRPWIWAGNNYWTIEELSGGGNQCSIPFDREEIVAMGTIHEILFACSDSIDCSKGILYIHDPNNIYGHLGINIVIFPIYGTDENGTIKQVGLAQGTYDYGEYESQIYITAGNCNVLSYEGTEAGLTFDIYVR